MRESQQKAFFCRRGDRKISQKAPRDAHDSISIGLRIRNVPALCQRKSATFERWQGEEEWYLHSLHRRCLARC